MMPGMTALRRRLRLLPATLPVLLAAPDLGLGAPALDPDRSLNVLVVRAAESFPRGGGYRWKSTGTPEDVRFGGEVVLGKSERGSYCCGFTFAVAMRVITAEKLAVGKSADDARAFQKQWYGAVPDFAEKQCARAVEAFGVGREVKAKDAQAGDFVQFWRKRKDGKPSGHSAVFLGWVELGGEPVGLSYLSSQGSTDGIGHKVEYFAGAELGGTVDPDRVWFGRLTRR